MTQRCLVFKAVIALLLISKDVVNGFTIGSSSPNKHHHHDTGATKSSRNSQETTDIVPPDDEKTLGDYIANEDEWFKDDVTDIEKGAPKSQLIKFLKGNEDYFKPTQMRLKIDLAHFLKTGESRPSISRTAATASQRVTDIDYDIRDSKMVYKRDLKAFAARLDKLFEWKNIHSNEYMAPYFPLIQSSGTGETKLMHEYKNLMTMDKTDVHVESNRMTMMMDTTCMGS
ncbi:unnamed protein product [Cylindrotheca closterium]|uniref:RxLR effector protein n=1 Tax=Cylindrotheca closterium TaxID=2856 RepID=A0AAD2CMF4_9STRA|nr:unnamed protein product [Cylindrotheca closterium]